MNNYPSPQFIPISFTPVSQNEPIPRLSDEPPARVQFALEWLRHLTVKQMPRVASNDQGFHELDSLKLTTAERNAEASACNTINEYLLGKLEQSSWEREQETMKGVPKGSAGVVLKCVMCQPGPNNPRCVLCKGTGQIISFPVIGE